MANSTRTQLSTDSLSLFPDNNSQLITPEDLRDWLTNGIESFVTQKDKSTFENAFYECRSSAITATSGTTNLALATGNFVHITGTGPISITSFGTLPAGSRFVLCFDIAVTLVYNATTMILPGAANIVTAPGDSVMIISEGGGNWRLIGYFPSAGLPVGTVTSVTASAPLSSTGGNAPDISISQAGASTDGYLDSADWTTFNGKQDALTLTTSGTSGAATLIGSTLNIPQYSGGGGGTPGGADTQIQYNNGGAFGGVSDLTWDDINSVLTINTPRIGQSNGNGHFHMHSANSGPSGITDYLTVFWEKVNRSLGFRSELETFKNYLKFTQPTADRTLTIPDATGNVLMDTVLPVLNNGNSEGQIRLKEATANGSNYIGIKSPSALSTDYTLTLPVSGPGSGQTIVSDGSGNLSWVTPSSPSAKFISTNAVSTVTGTTAETYLQQLLIPANTFSVGDGLGIIFRATRVVAATTMTWRFYISNVSTSFSGKPQMSILSYPNNAATSLQVQRNIFIAGATTSYFTFAGGVARNTDFSGDNFSIANIDWTADVYLIMTCQPGNTTASSTSVGISVCPT